MSQRKIAILSICAAWFAVLCVILLGFIIGKHLVVLIIFSAISAFFCYPDVGYTAQKSVRAVSRLPIHWWF